VSTTHRLEFRQSPRRSNPAALVRSAIDPAVAIGTLVATTLHFSAHVAGADLILALLVLAMTYPSRVRPAVTAGSALLGEIVTSWVTVVGLLLLLGWATRTLDAFEPRALVAWVLVTPVLMFAAHRFAPPLLIRVMAMRGVQRTAVIVGANELGRDLRRRIAASPLLGVRVVGYFDDRDVARLGGVDPRDKLGAIDQLGDFVKQRHIDVIYIALPMCSQPRILRLLDELRDTTASIYFVPDIFLFDLIQARVDLIAGVPALAVCESPFHGVHGVVKRASDIVLASLFLLLTAPLLVAIALGVRHSSPGPVIFRQRRYGIDGREIVIYKFRTMTCMEDGAALCQATRDDPRTTPFGRLLRKHSLDELPQFVNVLQGRMSVVGPRPHAVAHNEAYRKLIRGYMLRHKVRPGMTGLAQVNGLRGETATIDRMRARVECDLDYLRHWSLLLDLQIVLRTILVVLLNRNENAY
jgi:putative colanic acid biosysnthesis UDP-glucose lipid carrier transferase